MTISAFGSGICPNRRNLGLTGLGWINRHHPHIVTRVTNQHAGVSTWVVATISPVELLHRHQSGQPCDLIDVRTPVEFRGDACRVCPQYPAGQNRSAIGNGKAEWVGGSAPLFNLPGWHTQQNGVAKNSSKPGYQNVVSVEGGTAPPAKPPACQWSEERK